MLSSGCLVLLLTVVPEIHLPGCCGAPITWKHSLHTERLLTALNGGLTSCCWIPTDDKPVLRSLHPLEPVMLRELPLLQIHELMTELWLAARQRGAVLPSSCSDLTAVANGGSSGGAQTKTGS